MSTIETVESGPVAADTYAALESPLFHCGPRRNESSAIASLGQRLGVYLSLLISLRAKHAPTAAHCLRVAQNLTAWGLYYRLPSEDVEKFELAGLLHDLGKIGIPERILQKPSPLLPEERVLVEIHPLVGQEILRTAGVNPEVIDAIRQLGLWYDNNNRRDQTEPLSVTQRILSIVDAFDAMTSEQTYRRALSVEQSLTELRRMSGSQFDPRLVQSFEELVRNANEELRQKVEHRWQECGVSNSMVHLFQHHTPADCEGSIAIQALSQVFHRQMMDHMNDAVIFIDTESRILEWNKAAEKLTGLHRMSILHADWEPGLIGLANAENETISNELCPIREALRTGKPATRRLCLQQPGGKRMRVEAQLMPVYDDRGTLRGGAMILDDASEQAGLEEKVQELHVQATQDPLTKVANRAELNRRLPDFVAESLTAHKPSCVLICDIDYFKRINDTHGHASGDEALKCFASILKEHSRSTDLVARYGGEEFVILCENCDLQSAIQVGENIRQALHRSPITALRGRCMTASFGVSDVALGDKPEDALERADKALLQAKQGGRDRVIALSSAQAMAEQSPSRNTPEAKTGTSWLSWLGSGSSESILKKDLLSNVPREIAIEKLKGFIAESKAEIIDIHSSRVHLRIDCRYAPMSRRSSDRPTVFEMKIEIEDVDVAGTGRSEQIQRKTRLKLDLYSSRNRDRRSEALVDQANRLRLSFQAYLAAEGIDAEMMSRLIPVYKPGADGR